MKRGRAAAVLALAFVGLFCSHAFAGNPVNKFTDRDGVPLRQYLRVIIAYSVASRSTCEIENSSDRSRMYCAQCENVCRLIVAILGIAAVPALAQPAQNYPNRAIRIVVPFTPGQRVGCACAPYRTKDERKLVAAGCAALAEALGSDVFPSLTRSPRDSVGLSDRELIETKAWTKGLRQSIIGSHSS